MNVLCCLDCFEYAKAIKIRCDLSEPRPSGSQTVTEVVVDTLKGPSPAHHLYWLLSCSLNISCPGLYQ